MEWISVKKELPSDYTYVLIYGNGINDYMKTSFCFRNDDEELEWEDERFVPTHWMPLPPPPKE